MGIAAVITLTVLVTVSALAVYFAEEPLDEVVQVEAAITGLGVSPLATRFPERTAADVGKGASAHARGTSRARSSAMNA